MKASYSQICRVALIGPVLTLAAIAQAQSDPVFTYQGQLNDNGSPVNGIVYLEFGLWDAPEDGMQVGSCYWTPFGVEVIDGLFMVEVDATAFGPDGFNGGPRWLEIAVTDEEGMNPVALTPRQPVTPAPYALYAFDGGGGGGEPSPWQTWDGNIYYTAGNVGIGEEYPWAPLVVNSPGDVEALAVYNWGNGTSALLGGMSAGVEANADPGSGATTGVSGTTWSPDGAGVYGANHGIGTGLGAGVWGHTSNANGYAGLFTGRGYFSDDVGIGRIPAAKLDVAGTVKMDGLQLTDSPVEGYVLTSDGSGNGTWQPGGGGGSSLWSTDAEGINYQSGNVGIGTASESAARLRVDSGGQQAIHARNTHPSAQTFALYAEADSTMARTVFGDATATSGGTVGVFGRSKSPDGYGVFGDAYASTGSAVGVFGRSDSQTGYGGYFEANGSQGYGVYAEAETSTSGYAGYFVGRGYFSSNVGIGTASPGSPLTVTGLVESTTGGFKFPDGSIQDTAAAGGSSLWQESAGDIFYNFGNVGIGTTTPTEMLEVVGGIKAEGFQLADSPEDGFVLTSDAEGNGSWQPPAGGESLWLPNGNEIYYDAGNVGVGVPDPQTTLHLAGGNWDVANTEGDFKIGTGTYRLKIGVATGGVGAGHCRIFAGGPSSRLTLGVSGQDRLTVSSTNVDVTGSLEVDALKLTSSPVAGYVLTSDSSGNATWQPGGGGGGFELPYADSVTHNGDAFRITNSGTTSATTAIRGIINGSTSSDASAAYFSAEGAGMAVVAASDSSTTIYATNSGGGRAVYASTSGSGGGEFRSSLDGGYGVKGVASSSGSSTENRGGWFTATNSSGGIGVEAEGDAVGVIAKSTNLTGVGVRAEATGAESNGVYATSPYIAVAGVSAYEAARFKGKVRVYKYGTMDTVFLVDSDGTTQVDVLQIMGGADISEQFDVNADKAGVEPGMVVCIDPENAGKLVVSASAYDHKVAGIVSGAGGIETGMMMGQQDTVADGAYPVALTGRVYVWADATGGSIKPGDLLTTSDVPGHAMKVSDYDKAHGATLGKAMTSLKDGRGLVLVLVSLQ